MEASASIFCFSGPIIRLEFANGYRFLRLIVASVLFTLGELWAAVLLLILLNINALELVLQSGSIFALNHI